MIPWLNKKKTAMGAIESPPRQPPKESDRLLERFRRAVAALPISHVRIASDLNLKSLAQLESLLDGKTVLSFRLLNQLSLVKVRESLQEILNMFPWLTLLLMIGAAWLWWSSLSYLGRVVFIGSGSALVAGLLALGSLVA